MDINFAVASRQDKETMFLDYCELLNSFDSGTTTKITINNRRMNKHDFEQSILLPMQEDGLDLYRKEYNDMLLEKVTGANSMVQEKYVTVSVYKKSIEEARAYFSRVGTELSSHFLRLGSKCMEMDAGDKFRVLHDFYRTGEESGYHFDMGETRLLRSRSLFCPCSSSWMPKESVPGNAPLLTVVRKMFMRITRMAGKYRHYAC